VRGEVESRHGRRLTVATKYLNLTRRFFAGHGIADYRIVESLGATEGAPASGAADLIVDISSTGATLKANGLKVLSDGVILRSEAHLVASLAADWDKRQREALSAVLDRLAMPRKAADALRRKVGG
jgi:ATP phosphoribosyltransferase